MIGLGLSLNKQNRSSGGLPYDVDYQAVLDYATTQGFTLPSESRQMLDNQLIIDLKAAGVWDLLHAYWRFDEEALDFCRINWKSPGDHTATMNGGLTLTSGVGILGDGSTGYIDTNFIPSVYYPGFSNRSFGIWHNTRPVAINDYRGRTSGSGGSTANWYYRIYPTGNTIIFNLSSTYHTTSTASPVGFNLATIYEPTMEAFTNGVSRGTTAAVGNGNIVNKSIMLLAKADNSDIISNYEDAQIRMAFFGVDVSAVAAAWYTIENNYKNSL